MAGKKHRSYLDDFQRDVNGEYQYRGAHYRYAGMMEYRTLRRSLWLCCGCGSALVLAAGCLPGATAGAAWYVTLPTMLALVAAGVLLWTTAQWSRGGMTLRAYVHARTVRRLPAEALIAAGMSAFGAVGQGISLLFGNPANWAKIGHFAALAVASGFFIRTHVLVKRTVYDFIDATK
mgnify:FL=1